MHNRIFLTQLILGVCFLLFSPSLSQSQNVTLTVGDGSGFLGSHNNQIVISLDNDVEVTSVWVNIDEEGSTDYLTVTDPGENVDCETTDRTEGFTCKVTELTPSGMAKVNLFGGVIIGVGTGPICTISYDVKGGAPGGTCRDLDPVVVQPAGVNTVSGQFCFNDCSVNEDCDDDDVCTDDVCVAGKCTYSDRALCDDGVFCNGADICFLGDCIHLGDACPPSLVCNVDYDVCNCDPLGDDECYVDFCDGDLGCLDGGAAGYYCQYGPYPCEGYDSCSEPDDVCYNYNYDNVTLDIGSGSGYPGDTDKQVIVQLENLDDNIQAIQFEICDEGDYLTITGCIENRARVPGTESPRDGLQCLYGELVNGCANVMVFDDSASSNDPIPFIDTGSGWIVKVYYDISLGATPGYKALNPENLSARGLYELPGSQFSLYSGHVYSTSGVIKELDACSEYDYGNSPRLQGLEEKTGTGEVESNPGSYYWEGGTLYIHPNDGGTPSGNTYYASYNLYPIEEGGTFVIFCSSDQDCDDGIFCNGVETCDPDFHSCQPGPGDPCDGGYCCNESNDECDYSPGDYDCDGSADGEDNCFDHPNGPDLGTCVIILGGAVVSYREGVPKEFITCINDGPCTITDDAYCQMEQGDWNGNGCGDVCECYADVSGAGGVPDGNVNAFDFGILKQQWGGTCPCQADFNEDGRVNAFDLGILKLQWGLDDCPACP